VVVVVVDDDALPPPLPQPNARVKKETAAPSSNRDCRRVKVCRVLQSVLIFILISICELPAA